MNEEDSLVKAGLGLAEENEAIAAIYMRYKISGDYNQFFNEILAHLNEKRRV